MAVEDQLEHQRHLKYLEDRKKIYTEKVRNIFQWEMEDNERYLGEYALASLYNISDSFANEIHTATDKIGKVFSKTTNVLRNANDEVLLNLGINKELIPIVKYSPLDILTTIGRFDFGNTSEGLKLLEFNADTPCSIIEAFLANKLVCDYHNVKNPNEKYLQDIKNSFINSIEKYKKLGYETNNIYFSSVDYHIEDKGTTEFLLKESGLNGKFVSLDKLRMYNDNLYALINDKLEKIDVLYRLHPMENFCYDTSVDGYPTGIECLKLVLKKKLAIINPPNALLAQTKALQALIWALHENNQFYSKEEHGVIEKYMIPTYLENVFINKNKYVEKAILGREGCAVTIFNEKNEVIAKDNLQYYWEQPKIYQKYIEMESAEVDTLYGKFKGKILWGSFLIDEKPSAITARIGGNITNSNAKFLPLGIKGE